MDDLIASIVCLGGLGGLMSLLALAAWQSVQHGRTDGYQALQSRCAELETVLYGVRDDRNRLALRVVELERYLAPAASLFQQLDAGKRQRAALKRDNQDLRKRLDCARVLVLVLASRAGVQIDENPASGDWRVV